jgi:osmotically inducible protein OsmC
MPVRHASVSWEGGLRDGKGRASLESSGLGTFDVSFTSREADSPQNATDPEELIGAAHATCFTQNLSGVLGKAGLTVQTLDTHAAVTLGKTEGGLAITGIALTVTGRVDGVDQAKFAELAAEAERTCPVSKALAGTTITLEATLEG